MATMQEMTTASPTLAGEDSARVDPMLLSIVLPTKNRPDLLRRALQYYREMKFQGPIYIADSSDAEHIEQTKHAIESVASHVKIVHCEYPTDGISEAHYKAAQLVSTKYVANITDTAFLVSSSLGRCVDFLERHPDYVAAHGRAIIFSLRSPGAYGEVSGTRPLVHRAIEGETTSARLIGHLSHYSEILYSVYRTETWRLMWEHGSLPMARALGGELLPACRAVVLGKVKQLNCLSLVRQAQHQRASLPDPYEFITGSDWLSSYHLFSEYLTRELVQQGGLTPAEAREVLKQAFWAYLAKWTARQWQVHYAGQDRGVIVRARTALRARLRDVQWLRWLWREFASRLPGEANAMRLAALLRPSSPDHRDFMPIYRVITQHHARVN